MKVYELMNELAEMSAGAIVRVHTIKNDNEMSIMEEEDGIITYIINYEVQEVTNDDGTVELDIY